jgi:hypothetical protein
MATNAGTTPADVHVEIDTHLDDPDISTLLDRVEREIDREYGPNPGFSSTQHRQDFEAALGALRIAEGRDRRAEEASSGGSSTSYEADEIAQLRKRVRRGDPGNAFGYAGSIRRDDNRHTTTTN